MGCSVAESARSSAEALLFAGVLGRLAPGGCCASALVDIHRGDKDRADGYLLPERLDAHDDESVLKDSGDKEADDGSEDGSDAAEE